MITRKPIRPVRPVAGTIPFPDLVEGKGRKSMRIARIPWRTALAVVRAHHYLPNATAVGQVALGVFIHERLVGVALFGQAICLLPTGGLGEGLLHYLQLLQQVADLIYLQKEAI